jgi:hypothetical protein
MTVPVQGPPPSHELAREFGAVRCRAIPAGLHTLESARPGERLEVRSILFGAGASAAMLRPGDVIYCRGRTAQWLVVELPGVGELAVHHHDARHIRTERLR